MENSDKPKLFKLPKPFAIKWLKALRSGKYTQTDGLLLSSPEQKPTFANSGFCCLGVAGHLCGYKMIELAGAGFLLTELFSGVPIELQGDSSNNTMVRILSSLNDGIKTSDKTDYIESGYIFREVDVNENALVQLSFAQIADFIEDNTEFYKVEKEIKK